MESEAKGASGKPLNVVIPNDDENSKNEGEWTSPLHDAAGGGGHHARAYSTDFVDDDEIVLDDDEFDLASNSSWVNGDGGFNSSHTEVSISTTDDDISKLSGSPFEHNEVIFEKPAPPIEYEHLAPWIKEHGIFLQAALDLLQERDKQAPTVGMKDPVILKGGPLKKASILMKGIWKVKYVEIRRGMLSYYENLQNEHKVIRKDVPLQAHDCNIRAVKVHPSKAALQLTTNWKSGAIFELVVGGTRRLWMASSRDERQSWMQAVRDATVGGSLTTSNDHSDHRGRLRVVNPRSPFRHDLRLYLKTQSVLRAATTKAEYIQGLIQLNKERSSLQIPVKWIAKEQELLLQQQQQQQAQNQQSQQQQQAQGGVSGAGEGSPADGQQAFSEEEVDRSIEQLWRDLQRDSVAINGNVYRGDQGLGPQRIMGALAHRIIQVSLTPAPVPVYISSPTQPQPSTVSSLMAEIRKSFSGKSTSEEDDSRKVSNKAPHKNGSVESSDMQHVRQGSADSPVSTALEVSTLSPGVSPPPTPMDKASDTQQQHRQWSDFTEAQALTYARDILLSGNRTRSGGDSYFCINTLLQNPDLVVLVPIFGEVEPVKFLVTPDQAAIRRNDKAGWITTRSKLQRGWKKLFFVLSEGILSYYDRALPRPNGLRGQFHMADATINVSKKETKVKHDKARPLYVISVTKDGKERSMAFDSVDRMLDWVYALECEAKSTNKPGSPNDPTVRRLIRRRSIEGNPDQSVNIGPTAEQATENHAAVLSLDLTKVRERLANLSRKASPTVRVSVEASTKYRVCTTDPDGDDSIDTWAVMKTSFQQSFTLTGGPSGRIVRGEEVVRVTLVKCNLQEADADDAPPSPRRGRKKGFFRTLSSNEETTLNGPFTEESNSKDKPASET